MRKKVIIIGGGVAGLSAAHELSKRNFDVEIYEATNNLGGKARSTQVNPEGLKTSNSIPGEHGFRFFPRFYKHITSTMSEIPIGNGKTVADNLVETTEIKLARFGKESVKLSARFPRSLSELETIINDALHANLGLTETDKKDFAFKVWQLITSCRDRRRNEYERLGWWEFLDADQHSEVYQTIFVRGLTRTLVAARAESASTKTGGNIFLQLIFDISTPGISSDRILNGPTNEAWIFPWKKYLTEQNVKIFNNQPATHIEIKNHKIESITIFENGIPKIIKADYYILATPVEVAAKLINPDMIVADPTLENIIELSNSVSWMNGVQFYLTKDIAINHGHTIYIDTPWALTSISQRQFWKDIDFSKFGDGKIEGILSIDVSDWDTPGIIFNKPAKNCSKEEIIKEIWEQLKKSLNNSETILRDEYMHSYNIDDDIVFGETMSNKEPLLVNTVNSWDLRPYAYTRISNLFIASDYVKTYTDLATMEGANEAAKRVVNCILDVEKSSYKKCELWDLSEPWIFALFRWIDKRRYKKGLPWNSNQPFIIKTISSLMILSKNLFSKKTKK